MLNNKIQKNESIHEIDLEVIKAKNHLLISLKVSSYNPCIITCNNFGLSLVRTLDCFSTRLMSFEGGRLRMDERLDASMSDPDLVPLLIQV